MPIRPNHAGPVAAAAAFALARGISMERLTEATGLTVTDLVQPERRHSDETASAVWRLLTDTFPDEAIGLQMAEAAPFSFFGVLAHAASYAEDLREAIRLLVRYTGILAINLECAFEEQAGDGTLWMRHPLDLVDRNPAPPEAAMGIFVRYVREVLDVPDAVRRVELTHPPAGPIAAYERLFAAQVRFERPRHALVLRGEALSRPTRQGDRHRFAYLVEHLDYLHAHLIEAGTAAELRRIRGAIADNARCGEFGALALAKRLGTTLRSLQRVTKAHGTSVRSLLDEAREAHARRLLRDERLSVEEVSFLVGYSAASAFRRAFKRWSGQSPAELRRTL